MIGGSVAIVNGEIGDDIAKDYLLLVKLPTRKGRERNYWRKKKQQEKIRQQKG
jgi:hypothetical protein